MFSDVDRGVLRRADIHWDNSAEPSEVKVILDKVLSDFGEILVTNYIAEASDPRLFLLHACRGYAR
jgi:hypothetical protein